MSSVVNITMDIRDLFQPLYEMRGAPAFQGWLHKSGDMITSGFDQTHGDMIKKNWKKMGVPYQIAKDAGDEYAAPAQIAAYAKAWVRFYTSSIKTNDSLNISATPRLYKTMSGTILKFIREVRPETVILDVVDVKGYPEYVHGKRFMAGDLAGIRDWMRNPVTSFKDERW